jgi:hypothetical protein
VSRGGEGRGGFTSPAGAGPWTRSLVQVDGPGLQVDGSVLQSLEGEGACRVVVGMKQYCPLKGRRGKCGSTTYG